MELTEIRALDKHLRDGQHLIIDLVPRSGDLDAGGYWMRATINGKIVRDDPRSPGFVSYVDRSASPVPGLPHVIDVPLPGPHPDHAELEMVTWRPVGLTDAEADGIEAAKREWGERPARAAREAAPDAPVREADWFPYPPVPGTIEELADGPVMVLGTARKRWIPEDGRSFHLDAEEGWLYTALVRDLTEAETALRFTGRI